MNDDVRQWLLSQSRRPHHFTMETCEVDLSAVMGEKRDTRLAMVLPLFSWDNRPVRVESWAYAQLEGYMRVLPWHVLSLYRNSDFAESDFTVYVAASESVLPFFEPFLIACNFPHDRVLRFAQGNLPFPWAYKAMALFHRVLNDYDGVLHSDASNFAAPGPSGERLELFNHISDNWDTQSQDFLILDSLPAPVRWNTFHGAFQMLGKMGVEAETVWENLARVSHIPAYRLQADWHRMWADGSHPEVRGPLYGISKGLRTDAAFRQHLINLMSVIPFEDGAVAFYLYEQGFTADDVFSLAGRVMAPNVSETCILAGAKWTQPDYLYGYQTLDAEGQALWDSLYRALREGDWQCG